MPVTHDALSGVFNRTFNTGLGVDTSKAKCSLTIHDSSTSVFECN